MKNTLISIITVIIFLSSCEKEPFTDAELSNSGWVLEEFNFLIQKPNTLKQEIYLYFSVDNKVIGHLVSRSILEGKYLIEENGSFKIEKLVFPTYPSSSEWEQYFIENYKKIYRYELEGADRLHLFYGEKDKMLFIRN